MNPFQFAARDWAYLVSLELSEVITHHVLPRATRDRRDVVRRFAEAEWRFVTRLARFQNSRTLRNLSSLREDLGELRAQAAALGMPRDVAVFVADKLDAISAAFDDVEVERAMRN